MRMRRKGLSGFGRAWLIIIAVIGIVWAVLMLVLCAVLREYESVQPSYEAEKIFSDIFKDGDADKMMTYVADGAGELESDEEVKAYLKTVIAGGEITYNEVISPDSTVRMYSVSAGDIVFAAFTVGDGDRTTGFAKFHYPELKSATIQLKPQYSVSLYLPECAQAVVNGKVLDASYIGGEPATLDSEPYFPDDDESFRTFVRYDVSGLFAEPEIGARLPGEGELELRYDSTLEAYSAEYAYRSVLADGYNELVKRDELRKAAAVVYRERLEAERIRLEEERRQAESDAIKAVYGNFIVEMSRQYNKFIYAKTTNALRTATGAYFKSGTSIYKYVTADYYNWATFVMKTINFADEESSYYEWLDEAHTKFKCRISATVNMTGTLDGKAKEDTEYFRMTAYVDVSGEKPLVYSLVTTESDLASQG